MGQLDVLAAKDALNTMLETLIGQSRDALAVLAQDAIACADATDRATVESDRHLVLIMRERDRLLMSEIKAALARVDEGEYGVCEECGEEIGLARLRAQPTATLCVHCKSLLEDMGRPYMVAARHESAFLED